jgi:hypothetical protein
MMSFSTAMVCFMMALPSATASDAARGELKVSVIGKRYRPDPSRGMLWQSKANMGGNTSVRNTERDRLRWKKEGYFQRNRDLGQVFTPKTDFELDAIVLRTGPADSAVLSGAPGAEVFLQLFAVVGEPTLHDNGTPRGTASEHGFSKNHRCDDYITGVRYLPLMRFEGGIFPDLQPTKNDKGEELSGKRGRLTYLRWDVTEPETVTLQAGKRYAFMVGFTRPGPERGFTLANDNRAGRSGPAELGGPHDSHAGGWALRREGDGTTPPSMRPSAEPPEDTELLQRMYRESLFAEGESRYALSPTTDGFPDVDTYRDLEFYVESR